MSLRDIPAQLKIDSEEDLRAMVLAYCSELGFDTDEISCEDHFTIYLGHHSINMNKTAIGGRSDVLISRNGKPLAIIETKASSHSLTDGDAIQAISYARLLATIAPFAIVTNGKETKVYDVLAEKLTQVDDPEESLWHKNGQQLAGLSDELRYEAAKLLVAINPDTFKQFCEQQLATGLIDLKSNVNQNKKYNPELYVERHGLNKAFQDWLQGALPVFAVIAPSGYGKTNFMCAEAEKISSTHFVLFYSAGKFRSGLLNAIRNDFIWEFHRDREAPQIFDRLDSISKNTGKKLLIFIDAIDEDPSGIIAIKNELIDIVAKIRQYPTIRLVLSCKSFDWSHVIVDGGQSFNLLAETINPAASRPERRSLSPNAEEIGSHLGEFTDEELNEAIIKYKTAYSIDGDFHGEILGESRNPLMLRFIAEIYGGGKNKLPASISSLELFSLYLRRKLDPIQNPSVAENILSRIASLIFASGNRSVSKDEIIADPAWSEAHEKSLHNLLRLGVLSRTVVEEQEKLGFEFNKFLLYIYIFKEKKLQTLSSDKQVLVVEELVKTRIGIEALDFYLVSVRQEVAHKVLMELAGENVQLFAAIITELKGIDRYTKTPIPFDHILNYLEFYNFLRDRHFAVLKDSIMPYTKNPLGIIFLGGVHGSFRARTNAYPQPCVNIDDPNLSRQFFKGPLDTRLAQDLMPVGPLYIGGIHDLAKYPQKVSYTHLLKELSTALSHGMLKETNAPDILRERIYDVLLYSPSVWGMDDPLPHERYWKLLGYNSIEELAATAISELSNRVDFLLKKFNERMKQKGDLSQIYSFRSGELLGAFYALRQLNPDHSLGPLKYSRERLSPHGGHDIETIKKEIQSIIPVIVENYKLIFAENFPSLTKHSLFFSNIDKLAIIEVINLRSLSEFPTLSYIVFPNVDRSLSTKLVDSRYGQSITGKLRYQSLQSSIEWGSVMGGFGYSPIDITLDGERLYDPKAWVIKTRFSSRAAIIEQVYSLISIDLRYLLSEKHMGKEYGSLRLINDQYLALAARTILNGSE